MAPRRARRATPRQVSAYKARAEKGIAAQIERDVQRKLARGIQEFAVKSMNTLAQEGPAWSGEFSASWGFAPEGRTPQTPGTTGRIYKYTKNDVPIRDVERFVKDGVSRFNIVNTADHAGIAIDEEEARFKPIGSPVKEPVQEGYGRPDDEHLRYQIGQDIPSGEEPNSFITADPDWYVTYLLGGGLQKDLSTGFSFGFERSGS